MRLHFLSRLRVTTATVFCHLACFATPFALSQVKYEVVLPEVSGRPVSNTQAHGNEINENGQTLLNGIATFSIWQDGEVTQTVDARIESSANLPRLTASSINRHGQVVGFKTYSTQDGDGKSTFASVPFYWDERNGLIDLEELGNQSPDGRAGARLYGINSEGAAVGTTPDAQGNKAFIWSFDHGRVDIASLDSVNSLSVTTPHSLNDSGVVVGIYRSFPGSSSSNYSERGFLWNEENGSRDLSEIDPDFFQGETITARDINNLGQLVGERGRRAFFYDSVTGEGVSIEGFPTETGAISGIARAYAVNERGVVAGYAELPDAKPARSYAPLLWTRQTGSINLFQNLIKSQPAFLPEGLEPLDCLVIPKSINNLGQISAQLATPGSGTFEREIILNPMLDFQWTSIQIAHENGVPGVLYRHRKDPAAEGIPVEALGLEIQFECSMDMENWSPLKSGEDGVRLESEPELIELFVPMATCRFIRPTLAEGQ